ncbi:MAG TPA: hypothetical protein VNG33_23675 [Polyangiaceae bacterium]|nr:hypothetical protein [Polyangiaceae bacterium]
MSLLTLRRLSYWLTLTSLSAACATYQPADDGKAGKSSSEAGAPDSGTNTGATGGSTAGTSSTGGSIAGTDSTGGGTGGTAGSGGTAIAGTDTGGTAPVGGEPAMAGADTGGAPVGGETAGGAGGTPDPGCAGPADCDDKNPCTTDTCVDTVCQHADNTEPCADDADDCTDDVCAAGQCTHPANTAPCEDDNDNCTSDVCAGDFCTHPSNGTCACQNAGQCNDSNPCTTDKCIGNQCQNLANSLGCTDDANPCTDDVCIDKVCSHANNTASCTDDGDACSSDVCAAGACTHPKINGCCSGDGDCFDNNVCTDDTCDNGTCKNPANTGPCLGDASPCTNEICAASNCSHPKNALCAGSDDIIILANKNSRYIVLNGSNLEYTGTAPGTAEVFEKVGEVGTKFKLRSKSNGLYVTLGAGDVLTATADQAGGMLFDAPACGVTPPWVGLNATTDVNGGAWVAADTANQLISRSGDCGPASATSWEKFQLISVTIPCKQLADCDDGNVCTDETCGGNGFCVYADHVGTCTDDANTCTDDVCNTGTCTHAGNGTCAGPLVAIQANRTGNYVVLNGATSYLEYTAATLGAAGKFEQVDKVGTQFKIRASNSMFVTLDGADNLIANASFAGAMLFDTPYCDSNLPQVDVALIATTDDDAQKYVAADTASRLIARSGACAPATATAYEKFILVPQ